MARFSEILDRNLETIKRPPPPPQGYYVARVTKMPDPAEEMSTKVGTMEKLTIQLELVRAEEVDDDELREYGDPAGVPLRRDFLFSLEDENRAKQTEFQLRRFLEHTGADQGATTVQEAFANLPNAQVLVEVSHRADPNDPEIVYPEIRRTAPLV